MGIHNDIARLPKFEDVQYFMQDGNIRIEDNSYDTIWAACKKHPKLRTSEACELFEREFTAWLLKNGKIAKPSTAEDIVEVKPVSSTADTPTIIEWAKQQKLWEWKSKQKWVNHLRFDFKTVSNSKFGEITNETIRTEVLVDEDWVRDNWENL